MNIELLLAQFRGLQKHCHDIAVNKGFWDTKRNDGELIALMHSELSELLEELRQINVNKDKVGEELADVFIRGFDFAEAHEIDLLTFILDKCEKNMKRPYKHGKQF